VRKVTIPVFSGKIQAIWFIQEGSSSMFCPHCFRASFSRICGYCGGEHEPLASRIRRRQGRKKLLVKPAMGAAMLAVLFLAMGLGWVGLGVGAVLGALAGAALQWMVRVKRYR
jgi:ABC-type nickel/cobalt efflux system permease component RcnA